MTGKVYLVGAGPGDARLITLRAAELLRKADVVLYDRLVGRKILAMIPKYTEKIYVGRAVGDDAGHQDSTNALMEKHARDKKTVVRLKGGDPTMFGRGGEEAEFLKRHRIRCEIVPGITSGIGSATYAGIPLTHRKFASSVAFVTGHEDFEKKSPAVNWKKLAKSVDTIVIMMGLSGIDRICRQLVQGGMDADTPAAVIQNGTTTRQRTVTGNISNIGRRAKQNKISPPSVIIIGRVVSLAGKEKC